MKDRLIAAAVLLIAASVPADAQRRPGQPQASGPIELAAPKELAHPAVWLDVKQPAKVRDSLRKNAWLSQMLQKPLGKGFLGSWGAFLGTRGQDLGASFKGAVAELVIAPLFEQPFRLAWYTAHDATYSPVLLIPNPSDRVRLTYSALDQVARKGAVSSHCPGDAGIGFLIARWSLAEHVLFTALKNDRLLLARHPAAVVQAYCGSDISIPNGGSDLELKLSPSRLSRGAQAGAELAGLGAELSVDLDVEGTRLVARGLSGPLSKPLRLAKGAVPEEMLKLIPASAPVSLSLQLSLPEKLDMESLRAFWKETQSLKPLSRTATLAWWPRGDGRAQEVALLWSRPADEAALAAIFNGRNKLAAARLCGSVAMASTPEVMERLRRACDGSELSYRNLGDKVTQGLRAESSIALGVQLGSALKTLAADGYWLDQGQKSAGAAPPEMEEALRDISSLPFLGFSGTAGASSTLVPRGFGS